jgi:hypothetical protein
VLIVPSAERVSASAARIAEAGRAAWPGVALSDDTIAMELIDEMSPGVIKINSAQRFLYVLMPMRVSV